MHKEQQFKAFIGQITNQFKRKTEDEYAFIVVFYPSKYHLVFFLKQSFMSCFQNCYIQNNVTGIQEWVLRRNQDERTQSCPLKHTFCFLFDDYTAYPHGWFYIQWLALRRWMNILSVYKSPGTDESRELVWQQHIIVSFYVNKHDLTCSILYRHRVCKLPQPQDMQLSMKLAE